ncbi:HPr kinase/phosphorylase [Cucumibacter marinus]|uniref:HPr kinase/phosphorylase n=1 Tax=Cucumibacter marinus TaxID=1121252 RepID=UPI00040495C7|nr:HPr kinase/phosphatase C-terminal domain-containing protein [Cucumibacter marinus]
MRVPASLHATTLVFDGIGVMITGPSGAGKSLLALDLIDHGKLAGVETALVADDLTLLSVAEGRLMAAVREGFEGQIELRGRGIVSRAFAAPSGIDLVIDLVDRYDRLPPESAFETAIGEVRLRRAPVPVRGHADPVHQRLLVLEAIHACRGSREKST